MAESRSQLPADTAEDITVTTLLPVVSKKPAAGRSKLRSSCDTCQQSKVKCSHTKPVCNRCLQHGLTCVYSPVRRVGRPPKSLATNTILSEGGGSNRIEIEKGVEGIQTIRKTPSSAQEEITGWSSTAMDVDFQYPTPQSISRILSDSNLSHLPTDWENQSTENSADTIPAITFQQDENVSYGDLDKFFEDSHLSLSSGYPTASNPFDALWDFSTEGEVLASSTDSDVAAILNFKSLHAEIGDLSDLGVLAQQTQQLSSTEVSSSVTAGKASTSKKQNQLASRSRDFAKHKVDVNFQPRVTTQPLIIPQHRPDPQLSISPLSGDPCASSAECCQSLIKILFKLSEGLAAATGPPPLDIVLGMEREMHLHKDRVLNCKNCRGNNRSSILLLTMVMERLVEVLERRKPSGAATSTELVNRHSRGYSASGTQTKRHQSQRDSYTSLPTHPLLDTNCPLLIGDFEVNDETKRKFLKRLWKFQLQGLLSLLKEIEQTVNVDLKDINHRLAKEMTLEVRRRLESLTGRLEMWE